MNDENSRDDWANRPETVSELRELPEAELGQRHDALVEYLGGMDLYVAQPNVIQELRRRIEAFSTELARREMVRQGERMEALTRSLNRFTRWLVWLTVLITISTIISVGLTAWTLLSGA
ncbi:MAG TPA: hypothetical protein VK902_04995 [Rubrobacter sp.]|jgi:hypothetical protein|nr:hypothetical protein [Rubrobacter sp.]